MNSAPKDLTPEEMAEMVELRKKTEAFFDEQLPYLRKMEEFERLNASVDKSRFEQFYFQRQLVHAQLKETEGQPKGTQAEQPLVEKK